jgi:hypothetical protein
VRDHEGRDDAVSLAPGSGHAGRPVLAQRLLEAPEECLSHPRIVRRKQVVDDAWICQVYFPDEARSRRYVVAAKKANLSRKSTLRGLLPMQNIFQLKRLEGRRFVSFYRSDKVPE